MDEQLLMEEGYFSIFGKAGARTEMPGCSLCMGNQARVESGSTVLSTSTRNFPNRLGDGAQCLPHIGRISRHWCLTGQATNTC